jgi:hypothetical protein
MEDNILYEQYIEDNCNSAIEEMKAKKLNPIGVHAYIRHIPIRGYDESTENAFRIGDDCLNKLYNYSKEMGFIPMDYSYEDFIIYHQLSSPEEINFLKKGGRIKRGKCWHEWDLEKDRVKTTGQA